MARPTKFSVDDLLDAAARAVGGRGPGVSIADIAREAGAPSGSIYHRFSSRHELLVRLWIRSIRRFQEGFLSELEQDSPERSVVGAALHVPRFCRENPLEAVAMTLFRQTTLLREAPESCLEEVLHINEAIDSASGKLAGLLYGALDERCLGLVVMATRLAPYSFVRPYLGEEIPSWIDEAIEASAKAIASLGR